MRSDVGVLAYSRQSGDLRDQNPDGAMAAVLTCLSDRKRPFSLSLIQQFKPAFTSSYITYDVSDAAAAVYPGKRFMVFPRFSCVMLCTIHYLGNAWSPYQ